MPRLRDFGSCYFLILSFWLFWLSLKKASEAMSCDVSMSQRRAVLMKLIEIDNSGIASWKTTRGKPRRIPLDLSLRMITSFVDWKFLNVVSVLTLPASRCESIVLIRPTLQSPIHRCYGPFSERSLFVLFASFLLRKRWRQSETAMPDSVALLSRRDSEINVEQLVNVLPADSQHNHVLPILKFNARFSWSLCRALAP